MMNMRFKGLLTLVVSSSNLKNHAILVAVL